jgi:molybdate transport system substrate-binding protein
MKRIAKISPISAIFILSLVALGVLVAVLAIDRKKHATAKKPLLVYCAAGIKKPMDQIARDYEKETGVAVELQYGGSGLQLSNAKASHTGDLFVPADSSYIAMAQRDGIVGDSFPIALMHACIAVKKGNPRNIQTIDDLLKDGITVAQANPDVAAIGKLTKPVLEKAGYWDKLKEHTRTFEMTVTDVGNAVKIGSVDAGIVCDATIRQLDGLDTVQLPAFDSVNSKIAAAVLKSGNDQDEAMKFARYLTSPDKGLKVFQKDGYTVAGR